MKRFLSLVAMGLALCVFAVGPAKAVQADSVSTATPFKVNKETKTITLLARVNGKYFELPTRHAIIFEGGKFGDKAIFTSYANQMDVLEGLKALGAKAGNNMTTDNAAQTHVQGSPITIQVRWADHPEPLDINDVITDSNGNRIEMHFGGNEVNAKEKNTGCIACLDSCPVGLISNATYTYGAVENRGEAEFRGNKDVLPSDGTPVVITLTVVE